MYAKGDLAVAPIACQRDAEGWCELDTRPDHVCPPSYDARGHYSPLQGPLCWLPHSCDQWIVGGPEEARALITDLEAFLAISAPAQREEEGRG